MQDWATDAGGAGRRWQGPPWSDARAAALRERADHIYELREVAEDLTALLPDDDSAPAAVNAALAPLQQVRPHALAAGSDAVAAAWRGAVAEFDARMASVEARVVSRLREMLGAWAGHGVAAFQAQEHARGFGGSKQGRRHLPPHPHHPTPASWVLDPTGPSQVLRCSRPWPPPPPPPAGAARAPLTRPRRALRRSRRFQSCGRSAPCLRAPA